MSDTNEYNLQISYSIVISDITQEKLGWCYNLTETTPYATHTCIYYSSKLKTLTKHRNAQIKKYEKLREKMDKTSFWTSEMVNHRLFRRLRGI